MDLVFLVGAEIIEGLGSFTNYLINSIYEEINFILPKDVDKQMNILDNKYNNEWQKLTVFQKAVLLHMAIINIHQFRDENESLVKNKLLFSN